MERQREEIIHAHTMEREEMIANNERMQEELNDEIAALQRDRDDSLLLAENEKQQVRTWVTHWNKMDVILPTTFSNQLSWMKDIVY